MEERAVGIMQATPVTTREKELHLQETQLQQSTGSLVDELRRQKMKNDWFWIAPNCLANTCNQLLSDSNKDCRSSAKFCWNASSSIITNNAISERNIYATAAAAASTRRQNLSRNQTSLTRTSQTPRALFDLVTVLDISGSLAGTKLALLKRAMGFLLLFSLPRLAVSFHYVR
ncbi:hypothetical protein KIW84_061447 [Lathyrus oleraceus]|uniref:Uncharacterized protein n=1 Tax=Pisum sativum TaxID=3888 RepID=A0A9D4W333_PEA|nr:hypothetical protein KIW84_061447 [Pisum sativum]